MKKVLLTLAIGCSLVTNLWGQSTSNEVSSLKPTNELTVATSNSPLRASQAVVDVMACEPGRVVHDRGYATHDDKTGLVSSDQGRTDMTSRAYQSFKDCKYKIDGLTFYGMFANFGPPRTYGARSCVGPDCEMTKPITVEVAFYTDNDGMPGDEVFFKEFEVIGERLPVLYVSYDTYKEPYSCFYRFHVDFEEELALYSGWFSVTAAATEEEETYWLELVGARNSAGEHSDEDGRCIVETSSYGWMAATSPLIYCFHGNGDLIIGGKALKLCRFMSINSSQTSTNKYEKVQVEIENVGGTKLTDATLALYVDDKCMGEETLPISIPVGEVRHYIFRARADLSGFGYHTIKVENRTPGDAGVSPKTIETTLMHPQEGMICQSQPSNFLDYCAIKRVRIGDIDNESGASASGYNDFTHISTDIAPGETLPLTIESMDGREYNMGVWIDWNDNGVFDDAGETVGINPTGQFSVTAPSVSGLKAGPHVMRVVLSGTKQIVACGVYQAGETEDYTLNLCLHQDDPIIKPEISEIDTKTNMENPLKEFILSIGNDGGDDLEVAARIDYTLPLLPFKQASNVKRADMPDVQIQSAPVAAKESAKATKFLAPAAEQEDVFTLRYDSGAENAITMDNYESAVFGHYYPADVLRSVKGMKVTSMDVYIADLPDGASIEIYGPDSQVYSGPRVYQQSFTPQENTWNHVVFDTPFEITGTDLWFGVRINGLKGGKFFMGIDGSTAIQGYGDMLNVGGNYWWSLSEISSQKNNFCVRVNLSGERTPEISWLSIDQKEFTVEPSGNVDVKATLDASKLEEAFYEAAIVLSSNDLLSPEYTIPVYMTHGVLNAINTIDATRVGVKMVGNDLVLESASLISGVNVYDLAGTLVERKAVNEYCSVVGLGNLAAGVYVINITYADGASESIKAAVMK